MKNFLIRILIFLLPVLVTFLVLLGSYIAFDPFKVLKTYPDYSNSKVVTNRDFVSTEVYLKNEKKYGYNSFIFGNSRTIGFRPQSWKKHLSPDASPYMFDASLESIYGIWKKIKFLDERKAPIKNVIILFDHDISFTRDRDHTGHLFIKHPEVSNRSWLGFQSEFFSAYCDIAFLTAYLEMKMSGDISGKKNQYFQKTKVIYDPVTNQVMMEEIDKVLADNEEEYYRQRSKTFYERHGETVGENNMIIESQVEMMKEIVSIFEKNGTDYRIVIAPTYDQVKFSAADQNTLRNIFGNHLYDFSGENALTGDKKNYYETAHFRPHVGDSIMNYMYKK